MDALIGYTGFVGGHLRGQHGFEAMFNSRNIGDAAWQDYRTVVCAAAPGSMFEANRFPDRDRNRIELLMDQLGRISARSFVLISSIAVLADSGAGCEESTEAFEAHLAYGRHRRELEEFCQSRFPECLVVRLPALFGNGLRKNFLFDIMNPVPTMLNEDGYKRLVHGLSPTLHDTLSNIYSWNPELAMYVVDRRALEASGRRDALEAGLLERGLSAIRFTNPDSRFQYYDISRLWSDIDRCRQAGLSVVHLAPEPLKAADVYRAVTGRIMPNSDARLHREDMRTCHSGLWGLKDGYIDDAASVLTGILKVCSNARDKSL